MTGGDGLVPPPLDQLIHGASWEDQNLRRSFVVCCFSLPAFCSSWIFFAAAPIDSSSTSGSNQPFGPTHFRRSSHLVHPHEAQDVNTETLIMA